MGLIFDILKEIPLSLIQREKVVDAEKVIESLRQELVDAQQNIVSLQHEKSLLANEVLDLKQAVYDLQIKNQPVCSSEHKILCLYKEYLSTTHDVISREIGLTVIETDYFINTLFLPRSSCRVVLRLMVRQRKDHITRNPSSVFFVLGNHVTGDFAANAI
jgi:hypothetical protein